MLTLVLFGLLAIVLAAVLFLIAAYLLPAGEQIAPSLRDEPIWDLPAERRLVADDVGNARLPVALRGYRFAETDRLLDRLAEELERRDAEIARLRGVHEEHSERFEYGRHGADDRAHSSADTAAEEPDTTGTSSEVTAGDRADEPR